jgi:hypothetical protein
LRADEHDVAILGKTLLVESVEIFAIILVFQQFFDVEEKSVDEGYLEVDPIGWTKFRPLLDGAAG